MESLARNLGTATTHLVMEQEGIASILKYYFLPGWNPHLHVTRAATPEALQPQGGYFQPRVDIPGAAGSFLNSGTGIIEELLYNALVCLRCNA